MSPATAGLRGVPGGRGGKSLADEIAPAASVGRGGLVSCRGPSNLPIGLLVEAPARNSPPNDTPGRTFGHLRRDVIVALNLRGSPIATAGPDVHVTPTELRGRKRPIREVGERLVE